MEYNNGNKNRWYDELEDRLNSLQTKYDFPENISRDGHDLVFSIAKEQYMSGNRSGIRWLQEQIRKEKHQKEAIRLEAATSVA